jgi:pimeloyl-ACP methyl ester carboxylesterase
MRRALEDRGHVVATLNLEPLFGDIDDYAAQLSQRIEDVCSITGASRVALVGHSMGGLVCQAYLRQASGRRVTKLITLGTPFGGSRLARFGPGRNARQMRPDNPWLVALEHTPVALGVEITTIASLHDAFVSPQAARLEGAHSHTLAGLGHLEMAWSVKVLKEVCAALEHSAPMRKIA